MLIDVASDSRGRALLRTRLCYQGTAGSLAICCRSFLFHYILNEWLRYFWLRVKTSGILLLQLRLDVTYQFLWWHIAVARGCFFIFCVRYYAPYFYNMHIAYFEYYCMRNEQRTFALTSVHVLPFGT